MKESKEARRQRLLEALRRNPLALTPFVKLPEFQCAVCGGKVDISTVLQELPEPLREAVIKVGFLALGLSGANFELLCDACAGKER